MKKLVPILALLTIGYAASLTGCAGPRSSVQPIDGAATVKHSLTVATPVSYEVAQESTQRPELPNSTLTPGVVEPKLTAAVLTAKGFHTGPWRNVPQSEKNAVYKEYGVSQKDHTLFEVDHLCPIVCGGSNDVHNLWAQGWNLNVNGIDLGAHTKDRCEVAAMEALRKGTMTLADIQTGFKSDWVALGKKLHVAFPAYIAPKGVAPKVGSGISTTRWRGQYFGMVNPMGAAPVQCSDIYDASGIGRPRSNVLGLSKRSDQSGRGGLHVAAWRRNCRLPVSSAVKPLDKRDVADLASSVPRPFFRSLGFAERFDHSIVSTVPLLIALANPPAIGRIVAERVFAPVDAEVGRIS